MLYCTYVKLYTYKYGKSFRRQQTFEGFFYWKGVNLMALTEKQKKFANEYLKDLNATKAAERAGYAKKTAGSQGNRMLKNVEIKNEIEKKMKEREKRTEVTQDKVIKELAAIAFARASDYAKVVSRKIKDSESGREKEIATVKLINTDELTDEQIAALSCIKEGKYGIEVSLCDKERALELLGRHLGMWKDKVEVSGIEKEKSKLEDILEQMRGDA